MKDLEYEFLKKVLEGRHKVIEAGGEPDTLRISKQAVEKIKLFGLDVEIVELSWLPDGVEFMVIEKNAIYPRDCKHKSVTHTTDSIVCNDCGLDAPIG